MRILNIIRYKEWLFSKIPLMLMPYLLFLLNLDKRHVKDICCFTQYILFLVLFYAFGYIINDYCDIDTDKIAGKDNELIGLSKLTASGIVCVIMILGVGIALINNFNLKTIVIVALIYFLGASYSAKPLRFKEKGLAGVIVSSFAQRSMPLLILLSYINIGLIELASWMILGFCVGLRYIFIHQYIDYTNDFKSNTKTFMTEHVINLKKVIIGIFAIEALIMLFIGITEMKHITFFAVSLFYVLQMILSFLTVEKIYKESYWCSYICVPMEDYYNFYLPLLTMLRLSYVNTWWLLPSVLFAIFNYRIVLNKLKIAQFYIKCRRSE